MTLVEQAARAMLAYEAWLQRCDARGTFPGPTADTIISAETRTLTEWTWVAHAAADRAAEIRLERTPKERRGPAAKKVPAHVRAEACRRVRVGGEPVKQVAASYGIKAWTLYKFLQREAA
jgi:hypothetical protein